MVAIQKCKDLKVYNLSFDMAMRVFSILKNFPKEEKYALVSQILRSSRSVPANISEGFAKRKYKDIFIRHLNDALGSSEETLTWIEFAYKCNYLNREEYQNLKQNYQQIGAMIFRLMGRWQKY